MKRFLLISFIILFFINPSYAKVGKGELTLSPEILEYFMKYVRNEYATSFVVSKDGKFAMYGLCADKRRGCQGGPGHTGTMMKNCKKVYGQRCFIFAQRIKLKSDPTSSYLNITKKIRWNKSDYEFPHGTAYKGMGYGDLKGDGEGIKKDMTNQEIYKVLIDLEFLKNDSQKTSRPDENVTQSESIAVKIKKLFELYKSGALGEEEFILSKKMLLFSES